MSPLDSVANEVEALVLLLVSRFNVVVASRAIDRFAASNSGKSRDSDKPRGKKHSILLPFRRNESIADAIFGFETFSEVQ
jgi:hypothetical protein